MTDKEAQELLDHITCVVKGNGSQGKKAATIMKVAFRNDEISSHFTEFLSWFLEDDE